MGTLLRVFAILALSMAGAFVALSLHRVVFFAVTAEAGPRWSLIDGLFAGFTVFLISVLSLGIPRQYLWLRIVAASGAVFAFRFGLGLQGAEAINLSLKQHGHWIFVDGAITQFGVIFRGSKSALVAASAGLAIYVETSLAVSTRR